MCLNTGNGGLVWDNSYGYQGSDILNSISYVPDQGYLMGGCQEVNGQSDAWVVKLNLNYSGQTRSVKHVTSSVVGSGPQFGNGAGKAGHSGSEN